MKPGDMHHSTRHRDLFGGPRICSQCKTHKPQQGGAKVPTGPYTERWVCKECAK